MTWLTSWWIKGVAILVLVAAIGWSYRYTYDAGVNHQVLVSAQAELKANQASWMKQNIISGELEDAKAKDTIIYRNIYKQVEKIVDRPVYSNICFDNDGLQLYNAALKGTDTSESTPAVQPAN